MSAPEKLPLADVQAALDRRELAIDRVGVRGLLHPMPVLTASGEILDTVVRADMYVSLSPAVKSAHMSRFVESRRDQPEPIGAGAMHRLMERMLDRLGADAGYVEFRFPYFVTKRAPVSGAAGVLDYDVVIRATCSPDSGCRLTLAVTAPVTSLCPCSKEISDYGAHNQRSHITIAARIDGDLWIEELVRIAEDEASCEVFGVLKRADEKWVTERAYDNPKFVEDLVRDITLRLDRDDRVLSYTVESENFESIHNHSAYALIERDKQAA